MIWLDPTTKYIVGFMIPLDPTTKMHGLISDPSGSNDNSVELDL